MSAFWKNYLTVFCMETACPGWRGPHKATGPRKHAVQWAIYTFELYFQDSIAPHLLLKQCRNFLLVLSPNWTRNSSSFTRVYIWLDSWLQMGQPYSCLLPQESQHNMHDFEHVLNTLNVCFSFVSFLAPSVSRGSVLIYFGVWKQYHGHK